MCVCVQLEQNKIRFESNNSEHLRAKLASLAYDAAIPEVHEEDDETYKLINGFQALGNGGVGASNGRASVNDKNERNGSAKRSENNDALTKGQVQRPASGAQQQAGGESVFKSANWLSDSELIFSLNNQVGGLVRALRVFQELEIGIKHVESRRSKRRDSEFEIFVDIDCDDRDKMRKLVHHLR